MNYEKNIYEQFLNKKISRKDALSMLRNNTQHIQNSDRELSEEQMAIYSSCIMFPDSYAYNAPGLFDLNESVDIEVLKQALDHVVEKHEILRSVYDADSNGKIVRKTKKNIEISLPMVYLKEDEVLKQKIYEANKIPFDLKNGPLFRCSIYIDNSGKKYFFSCFHHLIFDGLSAQIFTKEIREFYIALKNGGSLDHNIIDDHFDEYVVEEKEYLKSEESVSDKEYWINQLSCEDVKLKIQGKTLESGIVENEGDTCSSELDSNLKNKLINANYGKPVSLFTKMLAAYMLLLYKYGNCNDIRVGTPIANRNWEYDDSIGCYINMMVMRKSIDPDSCIKDFVIDLQYTVLDGMEHSNYPYYDLIKNISKMSKKIIPQLFQSAFYFNEWNDVMEESFSSDMIYDIHQVGEYDLALEALKKSDGDFVFHLKYNKKLFNESFIMRMLSDYREILNSLTDPADKTISKLIDADRKEDKPFIEMFRNQAECSPNAIAAVCGNESVTYSDLYVKAGKLAKHLISKGVKKGTYVGIFMKRSIDLLISLLAVQMSGGIYIPLDPLYPDERLRYMFEETELKYIITESSLENNVIKDVSNAILIDKIKDELNNIPMMINEIVCKIEVDDLVYILFTSGSTGRPKGIMISHGALSNFLISMKNSPGCSSSDVLLAITTICFDIAGLEMYLMLIAGGKIDIVEDDIARDGIRLLEKIRSSDVTIMQATPATWQMLIAADWNEKRKIKILCGGEALTRELADKLLDRSDEVWNMYGPTETTIWSTISKVERNVAIDLGYPIRNTTIYVMDENKKEVENGEIGELYIGGAGVARGYINRPEETEKRFIYYDKTNEVIYKTGDLVKKFDDGRLIYVGRADFQVKINGFRIELGEIEDALLENEGINQAVVVIDDVSKKLAAFLIAVSEDNKPDVNTLSEQLKKCLPDYMVPKKFIYLEEYPLTLNRKVDRKKLSAYNSDTVEDDIIENESPIAAEENNNDRSGLKKLVGDRLKQIISEIGKIDPAKIDENVNLGEYDFDSIRFTNLCVTINKHYGIDTNPSMFYSFQTIAEIIEHLVAKYDEKIKIVEKWTDKVKTPSSDNVNVKKENKAVKADEKNFRNETDGVAIIGVGGVLPGADDPEMFWDNLLNGKNSITEVPRSRWDWRKYFGRNDDDPNRMSSKWGGFINDPDKFDAGFFKISPVEAELMDPQQRIILQVVWGTFENAGYDPKTFSGHDVGVFIGATSTDYMEISLRESSVKPHTLTGIANSIISNRISYLYNFLGPSETIDTACSSGLVSICRAVDAINNGECECAIAGGVNMLLSPFTYIALGNASMLSKDGSCKAFDERANGYVRGEGAVTLLLKPLKKAVEDGDYIYAVIKGTAVNHGGRANSLTAPNSNAQCEVIKKAYHKANIDPSTIGYIETHGTGTALGDPVEVNGLTMAFRDLYKEWGISQSDQQCGLGSVKTNIGHLEAASGAASMLKMALAIDHKLVPANNNFNKLNPYIHLEDTPFFIQSAKKEWKNQIKNGKKIPLRGGVSSFGFGGANAHIVVEEYIKPELNEKNIYNDKFIIPISAQYSDGLVTIANNLLRYIEKLLPEKCNGFLMNRIAYTLQTGREAMKYRKAFVVGSFEELKAELSAFVNKYDPNTASSDTLNNGFIFEASDIKYIIERYKKDGNIEKIAKIWENGWPIEWKSLYDEVIEKLPLPTYPFNKESYYLSIYSNDKFYYDHKPYPLIDGPLLSESMDEGMCFEKDLSCCDPVVGEHIVKDNCVMPGTSYLEMALEGVDSIVKLKSVKLSDVSWQQQLVVEQKKDKKVKLKLNKKEENYEYQIITDDPQHIVHGSGCIELTSSKSEYMDIQSVIKRCGGTIGREDFYKYVENDADICYGKYFQGVETIYYNDSEAVGILKFTEKVVKEQQFFYAHPVIMDCALQVMGYLLGKEKGNDKTKIPFSAEKIIINGRLDKENYHVYVKTITDGIHDIYLLDENGHVEAFIERLVSREVEDNDFFFVPCLKMLEKETDEQMIPSTRCMIVYSDDTIDICSKIAEKLAVSAIRLNIDNIDRIKESIIDNNVESIYFISSLITDNSHDLDKTGKNGIITFFTMIKKLQDIEKQLDICILTNQVFAWKNDNVLPLNASLYGFSQSAAKENNNLTFRLYDLEDTSVSTLNKHFDRIVSHKDKTESIIIREDCWYEKKWYTYKFNKHIHNNGSFKQNGTYLITGMGGIGKEIGKYLASEYNAKIVYISKGTLTDDKMQVIIEIGSLGGSAYYYRADLTDEYSVKEAAIKIKNDGHLFNGVIMGTMVLNDMSIAAMDEHTLMSVIEPKEKAIIYLWDQLDKNDLDFVLIMSSVSGIIGSAGQSNYSAACAVSDALADSMRSEGNIPVKVINWSYWGSVGAVSSSEYNKKLIAKGLYPVHVKEGMQVIEKCLSSNEEHICMCKAANKVLNEMGFELENRICDYDEEIPSLADKINIVNKPNDENYRIEEGFREIDNYGSRLVLDYFQKHDIFVYPNGSITFEETVKKLSVIGKYYKLLRAFFSILIKSGHIEFKNNEYVSTDKVSHNNIDDVIEENYPELSAYSRLMKVCAASFTEILSGEVKETDVMFPGGSKDLVTGIYKGNVEVDYFNSFVSDWIEKYISMRISEDKNCKIRLAEIGAGTGGTSLGVFKAISKYEKNIQYIYTDISPSFTNYGERVYGEEYPFTEYWVLNIEKNPVDQDFSENSFDIVLATNVLHATKSIDNTMNNIKLLLKKHGVVLINELTEFKVFSTITFGLTDGWWMFRDELRLQHSPLLSVDMWKRRLSEIGYTNIKIMPGADEWAEATQHVIAAESNGCVIAAKAKINKVEKVKVERPIVADEKVKRPVKVTKKIQPKNTVDKSISEDRLRELTILWIKEDFSRILKIDAKKLHEDSSVDEIGIDSLLIIEIHKNWNKVFPQIPSTVLFEYTTIGKIADFLINEYRKQLLDMFTIEDDNISDDNDEIAEEVYEEVYEEEIVDEIEEDAEYQELDNDEMKIDTETLTDMKTSKDHSDDDIAIIGVAGKYPKSDDIYEFWKNLKDGVDCTTTIPADRWNWENYYDQENKQPGKSYSKWGGFINDVMSFDAEFFGFTEEKARELDPQERLMLENTWNTLEDAGYPGRSLSKLGKNVGVFIGTMYEGYNLMAVKAWENGIKTNAQAAHWMIPNRISHYFGFTGPSISFDTACASSMTAINYACKSIKNGDCDMAIAGGINLILHPRQHIRLANLNSLSHSGKTMSFNQNADGFVEGEGVGTVLLKSLKDAIRDNDYIYGVIKACNVNSNGGDNAFAMPNIARQAELIGRSLTQSGLKPEDINYVEAHAAGTLLGDPVEIGALNKVFSEKNSSRRCPVGTVKANIGHVEAASGIAALTKVLLQIKYKKIAPSINCEPINNLIPLKDSIFYINKTLTDWYPEDENCNKKLRRACINSNGAGGSNANIIVEEFKMRREKTIGDNEEVIVLSANNKESLKEYAEVLKDFLVNESSDKSLGDVAFTLQTGRKAMEYRAAFTASSLNECIDKLKRIADSDNKEIFYGYAAEPGDICHDINGSTFDELAEKWVNGAVIDWDQLDSNADHGRIPLPTYRFKHKNYTICSEDLTNVNIRDHLDTETYSGSETFISQHLAFGKATMIGMTYLSLADRVLSESSNKVALKKFIFLEPLSIEHDESALIKIEQTEDGKVLCIADLNGSKKCVASAEKKELTEEYFDSIQIPSFDDHEKIDVEKLYQMKSGIYGNAFHSIECVYRKDNEIWGKLKLDLKMSLNDHSYRIHPVLLDSAILCRMVDNQGSSMDKYIPFMVKEFYVADKLEDSCYCHVKKKMFNYEIWEGDLELISEKTGKICACMKGVVCRKITEDDINKKEEGTVKEQNNSNNKFDEVKNNNVNIINYLSDIISDYTNVKISEADLSKNFMTLGCDSKGVIVLSQKIQDELNIDLYPTVFFEYTSIKELADHLLNNYPDECQRFVQNNYAEKIEKNETEIITDVKNIDEDIISNEIDIDKKSSEGNSDDIAIIGISGMFPQASDLDEFWDNMISNRNTVTTIPEDRWDWREYYKKSADDNNKTNIIWGGFMKDIDKFDAEFFGINPREAKHMDPQQRVMLQLAWNVIEDAGYDPRKMAGSRTGVFIGAADRDYGDLNYDENTTSLAQLLTGTAHNILTGRISYLFDFHGPSEPVDNACASSLVAIIHAAEAIRNGRCDTALAGGVHIMLNPKIYMAFDTLGILSNDGVCRAFDKGANGTVRGEGAGFVMLKRLSKAIEDKDNIYAVIKGTGISHGGVSNSMTAPNPVQQEAAIVDAFERADFSPSTVSFIETHGTGTILGDPIEITALKNAFDYISKKRNESMPKDHICGLGAIKTQIGHLEPAAGIAGILKILLCMKHNKLPGLCNFNELNPYIDLEHSPFYIVKEAQEWKHLKDENNDDLPYRAGVSAFGFSGVNAHILLEEYKAKKEEDNAVDVLMPFSAKNKACLNEYISKFADMIRNTYENDLPAFSSAAYTLQTGREIMKERIAIIAHDYRDLLLALTDYANGNLQNVRLYCKENIANKNAVSSIEKAALDFVDSGMIDSSLIQRKHYKASLPGYQFEKKSYWLNVNKKAEVKQETSQILIDSIKENENGFTAMKQLDPEEFYLRDHVVSGKTILPGVVYIEMARQAGSETHSKKIVSGMKNIVWSQAVEIKNNVPKNVMIDLKNHGNEMGYEICTAEKGIHVQGIMELDPSLPQSTKKYSFSQLRNECFGRIESNEMYDLFENAEFTYGKTFKPVQSIFYNENEAVGYIKADPSLMDDFDKYYMHPVMMEGSLQVAGYLINRTIDPSSPYVPYSIEQLKIFAPLTKECFAYAKLRDNEAGKSIYKVDVEICNMSGFVLVEIKGYMVRSFEKAKTENLRNDHVVKKEAVKNSAAHVFSSNEIVTEKNESPNEFALSIIRNIIADIVGLNKEEVDVNEELENYNMDSMLLMEFANKINGKFKINLTPANFFEVEPLTAANVSQYIFENYDDQVRQMMEETKPKKSQAAVFSEKAAAVTEEAPEPINKTKNNYMNEPIAVIGMAGRMPMSNNCDEFWDNLIVNKNMITNIPETRFDWHEYYGDPFKEKNKTNSHWGGFMDNIDKFDAELFDITPKEAQYMDPQQRILFELIWEMLEDAGYTKSQVSGSKTGVYIGSSNADYRALAQKEKIDSLTMTGNCQPLMVNKISHFYNFSGPSEVVDTLCSSSLVAIDRAVMDIRNGVCETGIAGGVNVIISPDLYISYGNANMLSSEGKCKTFDKDADGFVRAEGAGVIYLKPLSKAIEDNDHIYAVIRGSAVNHCGHTKSLTAPSPNAQSDVIRSALKNANVDFSTVNYLELHGTGTPLGDPIEINGIRMVYDDMVKNNSDTIMKKCFLGAVKTNVGHLESAAGIAGVFKILLAMKHKMIPANINLKNLNPYIDLKNTPFVLLNENEYWEQVEDKNGRKIPRRAGISSFGAGGVNSHIIFEEYVPDNKNKEESKDSAEINMPVFTVSAKSEASLKRYAEKMIRFLKDTKEDINNIAFSLLITREALPVRMAISAKNRSEVIEALECFLNDTKCTNLYTKRTIKENMVPLNNEMCRKWVEGENVDWSAVYDPSCYKKVKLPIYPFKPTSYWVTNVDFDKKTDDGSFKHFACEEKWVQADLKVNAEKYKNKTIFVFSKNTEFVRSLENSLSDVNLLHIDDNNYKELFINKRNRGNIPNAVIYAFSLENAYQAEKTIYDVSDMIKRLNVTFGAQKIEIYYLYPLSDDLRQVYCHAMSGFFRSISAEYNYYKMKLLQTDLKCAAENCVSELLDSDDGFADVKYDNCRYKSELFEVDPVSPDISYFKENGIYLITGGSGKIANILSKYLVREYNANVILIGRSELSAERSGAISEMNAVSEKVTYIKIDVTKADEMEMLHNYIEKKYHKLDGVFHLAGKVEDAFVYRNKDEKMHTVIDPKINGTILLDEMTKDYDLEFFIMFSSISAVLGNAGQSDYSYANRFLDLFAHLRNKNVGSGIRSGKTCSINWPLWNNGGMRSNEALFKGISDEVGLKFIETSLNHTNIILFSGDKSKIFEFAGINKLSETDPKTDNDNSASISIPDSKAENNSANNEFDEMNYRTQVEDLIRNFVSELSEVPVNEIEDDSNFSDYGIDSMMLLRLGNALEPIVGNIPNTVFFEYKNINELSEYLMDKYPDELEKYLNIFRSEKKSQAPENDMNKINDPESGNIYDDIAVIGISGRYFGTDNIEDFWYKLRSSKNLNNSFDDTEPLMTQSLCFEPEIFGLEHINTDHLSCEYKLFMEEIWKTAESAGYCIDDLDEKTGMFIGISEDKYADDPTLAEQLLHSYGLCGTFKNVFSENDTSLEAIYQACQSLQNDENKMAFAGAAMIASDNNKNCHNDGIGIVLLKKLKDAIADGDIIYSVIKGNNAEDHISFIEAENISAIPKEKMFLTDKKILVSLFNNKCGDLGAAVGIAELTKVIMQFSNKTFLPTSASAKDIYDLHKINDNLYCPDIPCNWNINSYDPKCSLICTVDNSRSIYVQEWIK